MIVGGGVIGTSIAFHLAEAGVRDVVLLERSVLGSGSTCKAAGGVRAQFSDAVNIALGARSLVAFGCFGQRPGQQIDLRRVGYLFLLSSAEQVEAFTASVRLQNRMGVPSQLITPARAAELSPLISIDGLLAAAYSPDDGHCSPESVVLGYASAARRMGARLVTGCEVLSIDRAGGHISSVLTSAGSIATSTVVCAAGAWSAAVADMAGTSLPVVPYRRQILFTEPVPDLPARLPMTIDFSTTFYFHAEGAGLLLGMSDPDEQPGFDLSMSDAWLPRLTQAMAARAPSVLDLGVTGGWAGLYEVTPDHNAVIGESSGSGRFLYATGFSGHGFLQAPAVGEVVRDLVLGRTPIVDVTPLSADRFAADRARPEVNLV